MLKTQLTGIVTIDGANATGKTTLAEELKRRHNAVIFHQTYRFRDKIFIYHQAVLHQALKLAKTRLVVLDRLWMSEVAYAEVYRGGTPWPHQGRMVDRILQRASAVQVVAVERDRELLLERYRTTRSHRTDVDAQHNADVNDVYLRVVPGTQGFDSPEPTKGRRTYLDDMAELAKKRDRSDVIEHGISEGSTERTCDAIAQRLVELQESQLQAALDNDNFLGHTSTHTSFLIAGDTPNAKHRWTWPFFEYAHSSLWLTQQLHEVGFDETTAIWTNVNDHSFGTLTQLMDDKPELMNRVQMIALGSKAAKTLANRGFKPSVIPHPQWGRRFAADGASYRDAIRSAMALAHPTFLSPDRHSR
jgi:hypothetical protein